MSAPTLTREEIHKIAAVESSHWWYVGMREIFFALLRPFAVQLGETARAGQPLRILDVGCGTGGNLAVLNTLGEARGIDIDPLCVEYCRKRGLRVDPGSMTALGAAAGSLDLITVFDVLTAVPRSELPAVLSGMHQALAPGGLLAFREPAMAMARGAHDPYVGIQYRPSVDEVREALTRAGFEPLRVTYHNTLLFPLIAGARRVQLWLRPTLSASDVRPTAAPLNALLLGVLRFERRLLQLGDAWFGVSVLAVARKPR